MCIARKPCREKMVARTQKNELVGIPSDSSALPARRCPSPTVSDPDGVSGLYRSRPCRRIHAKPTDQNCGTDETLSFKPPNRRSAPSMAEVVRLQKRLALQRDIEGDLA